MRSFPNNQNKYSPSTNCWRSSAVRVPAFSVKSQTLKSVVAAARHAASENDDNSEVTVLIAASRAGSFKTFSSESFVCSPHSYLSSGIGFSAASTGCLQLRAGRRCWPIEWSASDNQMAATTRSVEVTAARVIGLSMRAFYSDMEQLGRGLEGTVILSQ